MARLKEMVGLAVFLQAVSVAPALAGAPVRALASGLSESLHARAEYPLQSPKPRERSHRARAIRAQQGASETRESRQQNPQIQMGPKFTNIEAVPLFSIFF